MEPPELGQLLLARGRQARHLRVLHHYRQVRLLLQEVLLREEHQQGEPQQGRQSWVVALRVSLSSFF